MEKMLVEWIQGEIGKGRRNLSRKEIQLRAIDFSSDLSFKASKGWLERFIKRNQQLRLTEYFGGRQKDPVNTLQQLVKSLSPELGLEQDAVKKEETGHPTRNSLRLHELKLMPY